MRYSKRWVMLAAFLAYAASLALPALSCSSGQRAFGYELLAWGWTGLVAFEPRWLANPLFLILAIRIGTAGNKVISRGWGWVAFFASILAVTSLFIPALICNGSNFYTASNGAMIGAYLWVAAILAVAALSLDQM